MSNKTPYEIRLDLVREAREILQAKAKNPEDMPTTEEVLKEAERLNEFVSKKPFQQLGENTYKTNVSALFLKTSF